MIETLQRPWNSQLNRLFSSAVGELTVSSPYVSRNGARFLTKNLSDSFRKDGVLNFVSDLSPRNICQGSTDPNSFKIFFDFVPTVRLFHLPGLHAKVYIRDTQEAIVTSGNLTDGGVRHNFEYGISVTDEKLATAIRGDLLSYASLGASIDSACVDGFCKLSEKLRNAYQETQRSVSAELEQEFQSILGTAGDELLKRRLAGGSLNAILKNTILYLLESHGELQTTELHELVKAIHPDLCDDSVDRVINNVHFGKKWKHAVRSAQAELKINGRIDKQGSIWHLSRERPPSYWFKPVGSAEDQISDDWTYEEDEKRMHFSKRQPRSVLIGDILIAFAAGKKKLISIYRVTSSPQHASEDEIANAPWQERWPWHVQADNLTPLFSERWASENLTYGRLQTEFLESGAGATVTPKGTVITGGLLRGKDKLRLTREFGEYVWQQVERLERRRSAMR